MNMKAIAPGTFLMGQNTIGTPSHQEHQVTLTYPFWIGKYEVTQAEWLAHMGSNPSWFQSGSWQQRPVEKVGSNNARLYCQALTQSEQAAGRVPAGYEYRLPTEAEWEYCCRAGTTTEWHTGNSLSANQANFGTPSTGQTVTVGSYGPNLWDLHDMHGNVWEWCLDCYADFSTSPVTDPFVTGTGNRIIRGGSWALTGPETRSAYRGHNGPNGTHYTIGFRVVLGPVLVP